MDRGGTPAAAENGRVRLLRLYFVNVVGIAGWQSGSGNHAILSDQWSGGSDCDRDLRRGSLYGSGGSQACKGSHQDGGQLHFCV